MASRFLSSQVNDHTFHLHEARALDQNAGTSGYAGDDCGECIHVVEIDGNVSFRGHVNRLLLQRLIDAEVQQQVARMVSEQSDTNGLNEAGQG